MDLMSVLWWVNLILALNHTLRSKEKVSMKVLKTAASIIPVCNLHAIVRFKDYIEKFWRLIWSKSTTEIGLGLIFAPKSMLRLCRINTVLHISENKAVFGICNKHTGVISKQGSWEESIMYLPQKVGDRTESCGTPICISFGADISSSTGTLNFLYERRELISLIILAENSNLNNL
jgi:hypothetical protein